MCNSVSIGNPNMNLPLTLPLLDNNYCSLPNYNNAQDWDYASWDNWAKTQSINKDVKIYIGAPAATSAANAGMYVDVNTLGSIAVATRNQYSSFGGIMLWDASQAYSA